MGKNHNSELYACKKEVEKLRCAIKLAADELTGSIEAAYYEGLQEKLQGAFIWRWKS